MLYWGEAGHKTGDIGMIVIGYAYDVARLLVRLEELISGVGRDPAILRLTAFTIFFNSAGDAGGALTALDRRCHSAKASLTGMGVRGMTYWTTHNVSWGTIHSAFNTLAFSSFDRENCRKFLIFL